MTRHRYAPKYWSEEKQTVVGGVKTRDTPTQLGDILGTYVWVYSGDPEFGGDVEEMHHRPGSSDDAAFIDQHSITLDAMKHRPGKAVLPKSVSGHINWGTLTVAFDGLRCVREGWSTDKSAAWLESYWEVLLVGGGYDLGGEHWLDSEGNAVGVTVVVDDNGNPFLTFDWSHPPGGHSSWSGYYVGKKMVEGKSWRFTDGERSRLGIGYTFRKVEKLVKGECTGEYEEDEDEEESDEEDYSGCEDGDSDKEDTGSGDEGNEDANGSSDEEALSEIRAAGGKRKVRKSDTGANKRRRA